jgi:hypothetical protein
MRVKGQGRKVETRGEAERRSGRTNRTRHVTRDAHTRDAPGSGPCPDSLGSTSTFFVATFVRPPRPCLPTQSEHRLFSGV